MESLTKDFFMEATENCPVIPEIINDEWLGALPESDCEIVYIVYGDICTIPEIVEKVKAAGKMAIVHMDLIVGLSSKEISVDFLKKYTKVDGIINKFASYKYIYLKSVDKNKVRSRHYVTIHSIS